MIRSVQAVLDRCAEGVPYERLAATFLEFDRAPRDDSVLLLAEGAASSTGQSYATGIRPTVERFRDAFVATDRVRSFDDLAALELEDEDLVEAFGAQRKRNVLLEAAAIFADRPEDDDLEALRAWAAEADVYRYGEDPIGAISGVGPATFQYLRMLAGIDTAKPDPEVTALLAVVAAEADVAELEGLEGLRSVAACEWLAAVTSYRRIEIDRIAWWNFVDETDREAAIETT